MFKLDRKNVDVRDMMIFGEPYNKEKYLGGCRHFNKMSLTTLNKLIEKNFADINDCQNCAPSIGEIKRFLKRNPECWCHGYAVSTDRDDYRVSIEGVQYQGTVGKDLIIDFVNTFRYADELEVGEYGIYCWFD